MAEIKPKTLEPDYQRCTQQGVFQDGHHLLINPYSLTWGWYMLRALALCRGINTFIRKCLCSSFSGSAKPLIILQRQKKVNRNIHKQVKEIMSAIGPDECQAKVIVKLSTGCLGHLPLFFKMKQNVTLLVACVAGVIGEGERGSWEKMRGIGERGEGTPATRTPFDSILRLLANANFWLANFWQ